MSHLLMNMQVESFQMNQIDGSFCWYRSVDLLSPPPPPRTHTLWFNWRRSSICRLPPSSVLALNVPCICMHLFINKAFFFPRMSVSGQSHISSLLKIEQDCWLQRRTACCGRFSCCLGINEVDAAKSFKDAGYLSLLNGKKAKITVSLLSFQKSQWWNKQAKEIHWNICHV